jgi:putative oxidoreductase
MAYSGKKDFMQRLFSAFPNSWPGLGLLLLRLGAALLLFENALSTGAASALALSFQAASWVVGALLVAGLLTPAAGLLEALLQGSVAIANGHADSATVLKILVGLSLAMLGPGSKSVDALLFGRKRIRFDSPGE